MSRLRRLRSASSAAAGLGRLWQAATLLREHRGDGHFAALAAADIDGCEAVVLRCCLDLRREDMQPVRGWTDEAWDGALSRLAARGWVGADGALTSAGREAHAAVEDATDRAASRPWARLGPEATAEIAAALTPLARACASRTPLPQPDRRARSRRRAQLARSLGSAEGTASAAGRHVRETGLRTRRHHQHHDPCVPDPAERHETPDPVRSDAVKPRIQCVRPVGSRAAESYIADFPLHKFCQVTASSVRAVAAVTWGLVCHGRNRDRLERMLLDGGAASAASRSGKNRSDRLNHLPPKGC